MSVYKSYAIQLETYIRKTDSIKWSFYAEDVFGMGYLTNDVMHNDVKRFASLEDAKDFVEEHYDKHPDKLGTFITCPADTMVTNVYIMTVEVQVDICTRI